ncbi:MAG: hypothetical protein HY719_00630, partial [Planctomycetes bacterium]|nr:hypothetical protein [Planctomycetota bacterium]
MHLSDDVGEAGGQKGWAEITVRVAGFHDLVFDRAEACANQFFVGTLTFDAEVTPDILSHLHVEAVYLDETGAVVEEPISIEEVNLAGDTEKATLYFTEFFGGGPRLIRVRCGAGEIERPFTKVGIVYGELVDDDDPNRMITTEGPFEMTTFLGDNDGDGGSDPAHVTLTIETEPLGREDEFLFAFKPVNGVMPPDGAFQPAPVHVTFAELGEFEITLKCANDDRIGAGVFEFGGGPIITVADLATLTVSDAAEPASFIVARRGQPLPAPLEVLPGSRLALEVLTDAPGHEQDVQFEVVPAGSANPASGFFPANGRTLVTIGFDPLYVIVVYHDKNANGALDGNDPFIVAAVLTSAPPIDHLRVYLDGDEVLPIDEPANGHVGDTLVVTGWGAWSGLDGEPFTGDDVIMDQVPITAAEMNTVLADSPNPGGGPPVLSATTSASTRAFSQRSPAAQGGGGAAGQNAGGGTSNAAGQGAGGVGGGGSNAGGQGAGRSGAGGSNAGGQGVGGSGAGSGAGGGGAGSAAGQNAGGSN